MHVCITVCFAFTKRDISCNSNMLFPSSVELLAIIASHPHCPTQGTAARTYFNLASWDVVPINSCSFFFALKTTSNYANINSAMQLGNKVVWVGWCRKLGKEYQNHQQIGSPHSAKIGLSWPNSNYNRSGSNWGCVQMRFKFTSCMHIVSAVVQFIFHLQQASCVFAHFLL